MNTLPINPPASIGQPQRVATRIIFFVVGAANAAWAPLVPFAKARLNLNEGELGLLLLCLGTGSIIAMPFAGAFAKRWGCRRVIMLATLAMVAMLPFLATLTSIPLLVVSLFLFGAGIGAVDCVINIQAILVERASGRTLMSGFHGLFSVGGVVGAGGVSALLGLNATPLLAALIMGVALLLAAGVVRANLLPYSSTGDGAGFAFPRGIVLFLSLLCFIVFLAEGSILDWSAVFLTHERGLDPSQAGLGYTCFALTMMVGRFTGDALVHRFGGVRVVVIGGLCAAAGMLIATLLPYWQASLVGYALVGAGCANIIPVLFSAAGRQTAMPEHLAIPAMTTIAYTGILTGPAIIGFIAQLTSLSSSFLLIAGLLLVVAVSGPRLSR